CRNVRDLHAAGVDAANGHARAAVDSQTVGRVGAAVGAIVNGQAAGVQHAVAGSDAIDVDVIGKTQRDVVIGTTIGLGDNEVVVTVAEIDAVTRFDLCGRATVDAHVPTRRSGLLHVIQLAAVDRVGAGGIDVTRGHVGDLLAA